METLFFVINYLNFYTFFVAVGGIEPQDYALPVQRLPFGFKYVLPPHGNEHSTHADVPKESREEFPLSF